MKILFVTSEHPKRLYGGLGTFTREYVKELRKHAEVLCVYFHLSDKPVPAPDETVDKVVTPEPVFEAFSPEARILETASSFRSQLEPLLEEFKPDIIHCNDRQTYLPFRFDKNVFYSSHLIFTDLLGDSILDDVYFQEVKVERCAIESSSVLAVYSDFAAKSALKLAGGLCSPIVLPLGLRLDKFYKPVVNGNNLMLSDSGKPYDKTFRINYFGRFENMQKGVNDFIYAVNLLGPEFKEKYSIEYGLYGKGKLDSRLDLSLFDRIDFLEGEELCNQYKKSNIVVMPSRYEPFGFTGLEAMASGALVLLPKGLGMDMYARPGWNCLEIPNNAKGISEVLKDAVFNFDRYQLIRDNGVRSSKKWTWERCVKAHMYIYHEMMKQRISQLDSAYRVEERNLLEKYNSTSDVEKIWHSENERKALFKLLEDYPGKDKKILVLSGCYSPSKELVPDNVEVFSVLNEGNDGLVVRPECLPFADREFDVVIACGSWETVLDPLGAFCEMQRVSKEETVILYNTNRPCSWQTFEMEGLSDFERLNGNGWRLVNRGKNEFNSFEELFGFGCVGFERKEAVLDKEIIA